MPKTKEIPLGFKQGQYVTITSPTFKGTKLGIISGVCKYDGGIWVWVPTEGAQYECILPERGDTIALLMKE